jgi:F-type H+-transporting ATPase subunit b
MAEATQEGTAPAEGHAGGLPQFDFTWWPGEIVWFLIVFFTMMVFVRLFAAPRVGGAIEKRDAHISGQIADARQMKDEADAEAQAAAAEMAEARGRAQRVAAEARAKAQAETAAKLAEEESKLAAAGADAEARINAARDAAMGNVSSIATEAASAIVHKLTGRAPTAAELTSAVSARG